MGLFYIKNWSPFLIPNFNIDTRNNNSIPSSYKDFNNILNYSLTSSYQNLLSRLENRDIPNILVGAGFKIKNLDQMYLPSTPKIVGYNYWGNAST